MVRLWAGFWTPATMKDPRAQLAGVQKAPRHEVAATNSAPRAGRSRVSGFVLWPISEVAPCFIEVRLLGDSVAKLFLHHWTQICRTAGAAIRQSCVGPYDRATNSWARSVANLRPH